MAQQKIFAITTEGMQALMAATLDSLTQPTTNHAPVLVGIANSEIVPTQQVVSQLQKREKDLTQRITSLRTVQSAQQPLPLSATAIFSYTLGQLQAELGWCEMTLHTYQENAMEKTDFKKTMSPFYSPRNTDWREVDVPAMQFLMIDGQGNPNTADSYRLAVEALYGASYALKFMSKRELGRDYVVPSLEGLWYADDPSIFAALDKDAYHWTMMIMQPEWITASMVAAAVVAASQKRADVLLEHLRLETYHEGRSLQLLHIGSYDDEAPKLHQLHHELMPQGHLDFNGHHHEIYLGDPRRTAPEKLKTVLRQPIKDRATE